MADQPIPPHDPAPTGRPRPTPPEAHAGGIMETPEEVRARQDRDEDLHDSEKAGAGVGAGLFGALFVATLPWSIIAVIILGFLVVWMLRGGHH